MTETVFGPRVKSSPETHESGGKPFTARVSYHYHPGGLSWIPRQGTAIILGAKLWASTSSWPCHLVEQTGTPRLQHLLNGNQGTVRCFPVCPQGPRREDLGHLAPHALWWPQAPLPAGHAADGANYLAGHTVCWAQGGQGASGKPGGSRGAVGAGGMFTLCGRPSSHKAA